MFLIEPFSVLMGVDDFTELPLNVRHTEQLGVLPVHHADPFDRMLVAQALVERANLVTHDRQLTPYGAQVIWT